MRHRRFYFSRFVAPLAFLAASIVTLRAGEIELFYTDFEHHPNGDDMLVGIDNWIGNSVGTGSHGIDDGLIPALGKVAFIGFSQPSATFVSVMRRVDFNPLANAAPKVRFECFLGIEDSTNGMRDSFFITVRNIAGQALANLRFINSNASQTLSVARLNGAGQQFPTTTTLFRGQLYFFSAIIDFAGNRWSTYLDGIPIFTDEVFHGGARSLDLGSVAAEWQLGTQLTANYGNNFMIFDEWTITAIEAGTVPFVIDRIERAPSGMRKITWIAEPRFSYQLEYSNNLVLWKNDLPGSFVPGVSVRTELTFEDTSVFEEGIPRYYRVRRVFQP